MRTMTRFMENSYTPINRSAYRLAAEATDAYEGAQREGAALRTSAPRADEVILAKKRPPSR